MSLDESPVVVTCPLLGTVYDTVKRHLSMFRRNHLVETDASMRPSPSSMETTRGPTPSLALTSEASGGSSKCMALFGAPVLIRV